MRDAPRGEDVVGQANVMGIIFQLIDEDAGVEGDTAMLAQKGAEAFYFQLWRSFCR